MEEYNLKDLIIAIRNVCIVCSIPFLAIFLTQKLGCSAVVVVGVGLFTSIAFFIFILVRLVKGKE